jgi:hypothetical protein
MGREKCGRRRLEAAKLRFEAGNAAVELGCHFAMSVLLSI